MVTAMKNQIGRVFLAMFVMGSLMALMVVPAFAQADLATEAKQAATSAVTGGVAVAAVILAAVILYRIIKKFSS